MLLGNSVVDEAALLQHRHSIEQWQESLDENADILLYGCDVASRKPKDKPS